MERVGIGRRLPAALLDGLLLSVIITLAVITYSIAGGARLAMEARQTLGVPLTFSTIGSDELWDEFEREAEQMVGELQQEIESTFTDEEAEFIARTMADTVERYVQPENISLDFVLGLDANILEEIVDESFDAVIAADRPGITAEEVNEVRGEVKRLMDRFALGQLVPAAIRFALWLALIPLIVTLAYTFPEAVWGRTLGKIALGISVGRADEEWPAVPNLMLRYVVKYSPLLFVILALVSRVSVVVYL